MSDIIWEPTPEVLERARITPFMRRHGIQNYDELIRRSTTDIEWFWEAAVKDLGVEWYAPYTKLLDASKGFEWTRWFIGGKLNIVHNCVDRHLAPNRYGQKTALSWEGDDGAVRNWNYEELNREVCRVANGLRALGVGRGDAVGIYMPMVPEIVAAFFGSLKIGAVVVPVFSAFGAPALAARLRDASAKVLFTADGVIRRGKKTSLKLEADAAASEVPTLNRMIVFRRTGLDVPWKPGRDLDWREFIGRQSQTAPTEVLEAEDRALIIYTSGTTGKPKGTIHTHAGLIAQISKELGYYFDVHENDVFFWFTDIGWMMGPWEMIGTAFFGATLMLFEGAPNHPNPDRLWEFVDKHRITHLGISPTAIRLVKLAGDEWVAKHDLSSLRILGSTGEPWDPESYLWYFEKVGRRRCPIINISGGTEICGCLLSPLPITSLKPCTLRGPGLGMAVDVFDDRGKPIRGGIGHLVCTKPAPSMTKGFLNDSQRYVETYFSRFPGVWYHGDWAKIDEDGFWFLFGRSDDTIKVAGKRTGPAEIEGALIEHPAVAEAAAIGVPHEIKGESVVCFVVLKPGLSPSEPLREELKEQVVRHLGKTLRPEELKFIAMLPKTRSAKIVRGAIRRKYLGQDPGDLASIENPNALEEIGRAR